MKRTMLVLLIAGVALVAGSRVQAHHSVSSWAKGILAAAR